jgi:hypothetical protein
MDGGNEQRVAINLCFQASLSAPETLVLVQKYYGNEAETFLDCIHDLETERS